MLFIPLLLLVLKINTLLRRFKNDGYKGKGQNILIKSDFSMKAKNTENKVFCETGLNITNYNRVKLKVVLEIRKCQYL